MTTDEQTTALARIREVDRMDEEQIMATLSGEDVSEYVYSFVDGRGRKQEGLSWAGVRELAQHRGNIIMEQPIVEELENEYRVMAKAVDLDRNIAVWGGTHQPKKMKLKSGQQVPDDFAFEKAIAKAQRNAVKNLLPMAVVKKVIAMLTEGAPAAKPQRNGAPAQGAIDAPKAKKAPANPSQTPAVRSEADIRPEEVFAFAEDLGFSRDQVDIILGMTLGKWRDAGHTCREAVEAIKEYADSHTAEDPADPGIDK